MGLNGFIKYLNIGKQISQNLIKYPPENQIYTLIILCINILSNVEKLLYETYFFKKTLKLEQIIPRFHNIMYKVSMCNKMSQCFFATLKKKKNVF